MNNNNGMTNDTNNTNAKTSLKHDSKIRICGAGLRLVTSMQRASSHRGGWHPPRTPRPCVSQTLELPGRSTVTAGSRRRERGIKGAFKHGGTSVSADVAFP